MSTPEPTQTFSCTYECHKCKTRHPGGIVLPSTVSYAPGPKPNEWVFECAPSCPPKQ